MNTCSKEQNSGDNDAEADQKDLLGDWQADLIASRDPSLGEKNGFCFFLDMYESWLLRSRNLANRKTANLFWHEKIESKPRELWQLDQWKEAMRWYLCWLEICQDRGLEVRSVRSG